MSEEELRQEAVRRRLAGESPVEIAEALGRTTRWVRKWVVRHGEESGDESGALSRSRAPHRSPTRTSAELEALILAATRAAGREPFEASTGPWRSSGSCGMSVSPTSRLPARSRHSGPRWCSQPAAPPSRLRVQARAVCGRSLNLAFGDHHMSRFSGVGFFVKFNG